MRDFNYYLSKQRITVEHAFGILKGRFRALQRLGIHRNDQDVWRVIEALLLLHNMCLFFNDAAEDIDGFVAASSAHDDNDEEDIELPEGGTVDGPADLPGDETDRRLKARGQALRQKILDTRFPIEDYIRKQPWVLS